MGNFGVLVLSVRSHPPSHSPLEGGRVRSVRALACGLNLVANHVGFCLSADPGFDPAFTGNEKWTGSNTFLVGPILAQTELLSLMATLHHEGAVPRYRFADRLALQQQKLGRFVAVDQFHRFACAQFDAGAHGKRGPLMPKLAPLKK